MPNARIIGVADAIVSAIGTAWTPTLPDLVERVYIAPITTQELDSLVGRRVYVFPVSYDDQPETRGENRYVCTLGVVIVERYPDAGFPLRNWVDERVYAVENVIRSACDYDRSTPLAIGTREIYTESIATSVFDLEKMNSNNLFWSELTVTLWEVDAA